MLAILAKQVGSIQAFPSPTIVNYLVVSGNTTENGYPSSSEDRTSGFGVNAPAKEPLGLRLQGDITGFRIKVSLLVWCCCGFRNVMSFPRCFFHRGLDCFFVCVKDQLKRHFNFIGSILSLLFLVQANHKNNSSFLETYMLTV